VKAEYPPEILHQLYTAQSHAVSSQDREQNIHAASATVAKPFDNNLDPPLRKTPAFNEFNVIQPWAEDEDDATGDTASEEVIQEVVAIEDSIPKDVTTESAITKDAIQGTQTRTELYNANLKENERFQWIFQEGSRVPDLYTPNYLPTITGRWWSRTNSFQS
jgi:hypothetical protein